MDRRIQSWDYFSEDEREEREKWNSDALSRLAKFIRLQAQDALWDEGEIREIIGLLKSQTFDYADAIELGNQVLSESPYPYELGSVYVDTYDGGSPFRKGGKYADKDQKEDGPIKGRPSEDCLKFQTPVPLQEGGIETYDNDPDKFKGINLTIGKWNPWLNPHEPEKSDKPTYNILKTLEYGYKNVPGGQFKGHSPHIVILYTGHE